MTSRTSRPSSRTHPDLGERLSTSRREIEEAVLVRIRTIADPGEAADPTYAESLRTAVSVAVGYVLECLGTDAEPEVPAALLAQARRAARAGVRLETVVRRYGIGHSLLGCSVAEAAEAAGLSVGELKRLLRTQAAALDRLLAAVGEAYERESRSGSAGADERHARRVRQLLAGELIHRDQIAYDFGGFHLALVLAGPPNPDPLRDLARSFERRLLFVRPDERVAWAWLGGARALDPGELASVIARDFPEHAVALGEPGHGPEGWRLSHRQAAAALPVAMRRGNSVVRYVDVALLAAALQDDLLHTSLHRRYVEPLGGERIGSELKETLRAYFAAVGNLSSAAAALGLNRATVRSRLDAVAERCGRGVDVTGAEIRVALQLDEIDRQAA